jgi:hypothetical protein
LQSWAPFLAQGAVVPAIAVDPDPAKRPECIVIRMDAAMVNQTCALNQNYHFMLSDEMQSKFAFTGSQKVCASSRQRHQRSGSVPVLHTWSSAASV